MIRQLLRPLPQSARRAGGRAARRMERAAPLAEELRPVRAGLIGGQYRPLDVAAVQAIDSAVYQILEEIGLSQAPESGIAYMTAAGAIAGDDGRIRFPRALVDDMLAKAARNITLHGQDPKHDLLLSGSRVHYGTAGAAVHVVDVERDVLLSFPLDALLELFRRHQEWRDLLRYVVRYCVDLVLRIWDPQMFSLSAARLHQAVARAVARSCADVSQLLLKLRAPLLAVAICKCLQKLSTSGSDFGNPQRFQVSATLMPQAVARAVVRSCVNASRLQPQLLHAVLSRLVLQLLEKL